MKRLLSLLVCLSLVFSLSIPAGYAQGYGNVPSKQGVGKEVKKEVKKEMIKKEIKKDVKKELKKDEMLKKPMEKMKKKVGKKIIKKEIKKDVKKKLKGQTPPATGTDQTVAPISGQTVTIGIANFAFASESGSVKVGDTVKWTNNDSAPHTVAFDDGSVTSPTLNTGGVFTWTATKAGNFTYHCGFHPSMTGVVEVVE